MNLTTKTIYVTLVASATLVILLILFGIASSLFNEEEAYRHFYNANTSPPKESKESMIDYAVSTWQVYHYPPK
jgi:hypothetical protein